MIANTLLDTAFDFQAEAAGRDSDKYSPTLQEYHRVLWSKSLPSGGEFTLSKINGNRLQHDSSVGELILSSDRAVANFASWKRLQHITSQLPVERFNNFVSLTDTIGGIVLWPSTQINGMATINAARGFDRKIADRLDLIECIRRYYVGEPSPLYETLLRYKTFFDLFVDFKGYVDFFLLQDAVSEDYSAVNIAVPFNDFVSSPVPKTVEEYLEYMKATTQFVEARNRRIDAISIGI